MPKDPHKPSPLLSLNDQPTSKPSSSASKRQPTGQIVHVPTSPSEWTRKDKNVVAGAVGMGVFVGLLVWSIFAAVMAFGLSVLTYTPPAY